MKILFLIYIACVCYITIPVCKIIWEEKLDNDLLFLLSSNYIFIFLLSIIFNSSYHLFYSILISLILMILSFLLIRKIKNIYNYYQILSIPYFCFCVYTFSNILILI